VCSSIELLEATDGLSMDGEVFILLNQGGYF